MYSFFAEFANYIVLEPVKRIPFPTDFEAIENKIIQLAPAGERIGKIGNMS